MTDNINLKNYNITHWPNHNLNYWGIPKCANTSVKYALMDRDLDNINSKKPYAWIHNTGIQNYIDPSRAISNNCINFTLVRNPISRTLSLYRDIVFKRNKKLSVAKKFNIDGSETLHDFLDILEQNIDKNPHFYPQSNFISNNNILLVDNIFKLEEINQLEKFLQRDIPLTNATNNKITFNSEHTKRIKNLYNTDFDLLQYSTEK